MNREGGICLNKGEQPRKKQISGLNEDGSSTICAVNKENGAARMQWNPGTRQYGTGRMKNRNQTKPAPSCDPVRNTQPQSED